MPGPSNFPGGFAAGVTIQNLPVLNTYPRDVWWVWPAGSAPPGGSAASDGNSGTFTKPFATIQKAVNVAAARDLIMIAPGSYDETVTFTRGTSASTLTLIGAGPIGSCAIAPSTANAGAVVNNCDGITFVNVGMAAVGTGTALINTGSRLRAFNCKLENDDGTGLCVQMTLNTQAQHDATPRLYGSGADCRFQNCEFAWAASGIELVCTDYSSLTQIQIVDCLFHNMNTNHIYETVGSGGSAAFMYGGLLLQGNTHMKDDAGTAPSKYILLNGNNANTGVLCGCYFPQATNGGKVLLSTALVAVGVYFTGGISTGQPS